MYILGISAFCSDSAVCLVKDGEIDAAPQGERFTRKSMMPTFQVNLLYTEFVKQTYLVQI